MDSFDGSRRQDARPPLPPAERRLPREPEPLEQRLDRWMSTGRQLVEGVAGGRPGTRQNSRRAEGRAGSRGGFDGLGRWVEGRLDWLLDDSDDWPEPWQQSERRRSERPPAERPARPRPADAALEPANRTAERRRPLTAISRRGPVPAGLVTQARPAGERNAPLAPPSRATAAGAGQPGPAGRDSGSVEDWPDDEAFSVPRWQRSPAPLRRADPLQADLQQRPRVDRDRTPAEAPTRPLPRSSRRR